MADGLGSWDYINRGMDYKGRQVGVGSRQTEASTEPCGVLLAACKDAENWLTEFRGGEDCEDDGLNGIIADLRAAIAHAEGR